MTNNLNVSGHYLNIDDLINKYQDYYINNLNSALEHKKMDEVNYKRMMMNICTAETIEEVYSHYESMFKELIEIYYEFLLSRIRAGAEFIESISKDDPRYIPAIRKYEALCEELKSFEK